jgi:fatty acid desaturase
VSAVEGQQRPTPAPDSVKLLAQAIVVAVLVASASAVFWLYVSEREWYVPAMALIVLARFAYDRFFSEG